MNKKALLLLLMVISIFIPIIAKADEDIVDNPNESANVTLEQPPPDKGFDIELEDVVIPEGSKKGYLECTYLFDKDLYNKKLQQIDINKSKTSDEYELARLEKEKITLNRHKK